MIAGMFLIGVGNGLFAPTVYRTVLSSIPPEQVGIGSGIVTTTQQSALALGVALLGVVFVGVSGRSNTRLGFVVVSALFLAVAALFALFGGFLRGRTRAADQCEPQRPGRQDPLPAPKEEMVVRTLIGQSASAARSRTSRRGPRSPKHWRRGWFPAYNA